jgi:hypothetical protein
MKLYYIYLFQHTHNLIKLGFLFCLDLGVIDTGNLLFFLVLGWNCLSQLVLGGFLYFLCSKKKKKKKKNSH